MSTESQNRKQHTFSDVDLHIVGIGVEYPDLVIDPKSLRDYAMKFYPSTPAMDKVLSINENTGIDFRRGALGSDHTIMGGPDIPTVEQLGQLFIEVGSKMVVAAARKAVAEWGGLLSDITHLVAVSSTAFTNPGYEYFVARELGLHPKVERTLLHGVGCAGGLAGLRTAANYACAATYLSRPARILVVACEMGTLCARDELEVIHKTQQVRIPITLFGDAATALVVSNGIGSNPHTPIYDLLAWDHRFIPDTAGDITFDVVKSGWRPTLTSRVPSLTSTAVPPIFQDLLLRIPSILPPRTVPANLKATDFDWALHPGGGKIIADVQKIMNLTSEHLRASYHVYKNYGNTSSATIFSVLNKLREMGEGRDNVIACAFGPGVTVETCVLKRCRSVEGETAASSS